MDDSVVIALFRHGLTEDNKRHAYLGWNDSPLCKEEDDRLKMYRGEKYGLYFASDLGRCVTTAKILFPDADPILLKEMREMNFGLWEGRTYEELKGDNSYQDWSNNWLIHSPPEGESFKQFTTRVEAGWAKIVKQVFQKKEDRLIVVTHGGVIRYLLTQFAPIEKGFWDWNVPHGNGYELLFQKEALWRGDRCNLLREVPLTEKAGG